jgi:hypothetical protein
MTAAPLASALLILASVGPSVEQIDDSRFRVKIVFDNTESARSHAEAQLAIIRKARTECRGKGAAVSEGTLYLNNAAPIRGNRKALELAEIYTCVAD